MTIYKNWFRSTNKKVSVVTSNNLEKIITRLNMDYDQAVNHIDNLVQKSFGRKLHGSDSTKSHIESVDQIAIAYYDNTILGFASMQFQDSHKSAYLHGICMHPKAKNRHIGKSLVHALLSKTRPQWLVFTTQNPAMFCLLRSMCVDGYIYPSPCEPLVDPIVLPLVQNIVSKRDAIFDPRMFVLKGLYDECLYDQIPTVKDKSVQKWFEQSLTINSDGKSNDGFIFVGQLL